jgi:hypothetical protein
MTTLNNFRERWMRIAERSPDRALSLVAQASPEEQALIAPEELARAWAGCMRSGGIEYSLRIAANLPVRMQGWLDYSDALTRWRFEMAFTSLHRALPSLEAVPEAFARLLSGDDVAWAWRNATRGGYNEEALDLLSALPAFLRAGIGRADVLYVWRAMVVSKPEVAFRWLGTAPVELRSFVGEAEVSAAWRDAVLGLHGDGPVRMLHALAELPEAYQGAISPTEVRSLIEALDGPDGGSRLARSIRFVPESLRSEITPEAVQTSWERLAKAIPQEALEEAGALPEALSGWLTPRRVAEVWDALANGEPWTALTVYAALPGPLQHEIGPQRLGDVFVAAVQSDQQRFLSLSAYVPEPTLSAIPAESADSAWRVVAGKSRPYNGLVVLNAAPEPFWSAVTPAEVADVWRAAGAGMPGSALRSLSMVPARLRSAIEVEEVRSAWRDMLKLTRAEARWFLSPLPHPPLPARPRVLS